MKETPLKAFISSILFRKMSPMSIFTALYFFMIIILLILSTKNIISLKVYLVWSALLIITDTIIVGMGIFKDSYQNFKKYDYKKIVLPKNEENYNEDRFSSTDYLKNLEDRIKRLEEYTPLKLGIYALFIGIALSIALYFIK